MMPPIIAEIKKREREDVGVTGPQDRDHFKRHLKGAGGQVEKSWIVVVDLKIGRPGGNLPAWWGNTPSYSG